MLAQSSADRSPQFLSPLSWTLHCLSFPLLLTCRSLFLLELLLSIPFLSLLLLPFLLSFCRSLFFFSVFLSPLPSTVFLSPPCLFPSRTQHAPSYLLGLATAMAGLASPALSIPVLVVLLICNEGQAAAVLPPFGNASPHKVDLMPAELGRRISSTHPMPPCAAQHCATPQDHDAFCAAADWPKAQAMAESRYLHCLRRPEEVHAHQQQAGNTGGDGIRQHDALEQRAALACAPTGEYCEAQGGLWVDVPALATVRQGTQAPQLYYMPLAPCDMAPAFVGHRVELQERWRGFTLSTWLPELAEVHPTSDAAVRRALFV